MSPNVLADFHHGALYFSLHLLFEKRLGWNLYRPIGYDWYRRGYYACGFTPGMIKQYLEPPSKDYFRDGVYYIPYQEGNIKYTHKAITFKKFLELDFDVIVASLSNHEIPFHRLIREHKPNAILIREMGNPNEMCNFKICRNILNSTTNPVPEGVNVVHFHPEFSLEEYKYVPPKTHNVIRNIMHLLPKTRDAHLWYDYKRAMPDYVWKMHGFLGEDGVLPEHLKAWAFRNSAFIWHVKWFGDGYGYVIHNAYASGRPCIVKGSYYKGKTAWPLLEDSVTCIDLELGSKEENVRKIRYFSEPGRHIQMCENAYKRFKEVVDFDREFAEIKKFLQRAGL